MVTIVLMNRTTLFAPKKRKKEDHIVWSSEVVRVLNYTDFMVINCEILPIWRWASGFHVVLLS